MKRIFLALKAHIDNYDQLQSDFENILQGRWVSDENLHITVCFFGNSYSIDEIVQKMPPLTENIGELELSSLGYFERNNILYAKAKSHKLETLHSYLRDIFSLGSEKIFIPHVTLMRIKKVKDQEAFKYMLKEYKHKKIGRVEKNFELMQSYIEHPGGSKYESIRKY